MAEDTTPYRDETRVPVKPTRTARTSRGKTSPAANGSPAKPRTRRSRSTAPPPVELPVPTPPPVAAPAVAPSVEVPEAIIGSSVEVPEAAARSSTPPLDERRDESIREARAALDTVRAGRDEVLRGVEECGRQLEELRRGGSEAATALVGLRSSRDELMHSLHEVDEKIAELRQRSPQAAELTELRQALEQIRTQIDTARAQTATLGGEAAAASDTCRAVSQHAESVRKDVEAARQSAEEAAHIARLARERAAETVAEAERIDGHMQSLDGRLQARRQEFAQLDAEARRALDEWRQAVEQARAALPPPPPPAPAPEPIRPAVSEAARNGLSSVAETPAAEPVAAPANVRAIETHTIDDVEEIPEEQLAADAPGRLIRFLNDAHAVEKEQIDLLHKLAETTADTELRELLQEHEVITRQQLHAVEERLQAMRVTPTGGRGLLSRIATRVWEALQEPRDEIDDTVQRLLEALSAAEFEAGMYLALHALARAIGATSTAELAQAHFQQERDFSTRLRARIIPTVIRTARLQPIAAARAEAEAEAEAAPAPTE